MFSYAESTAASPLPCGTIAMPEAAARARVVTSPSSTRTLPRDGSSAPAIAHSREVLPAPDGPVTASSWPDSIRSDTDATATPMS